MEPFLADWLSRSRAPKLLRITVLTVLIGVLQVMSIDIAFGKETDWAALAGLFSAAIFLGACAYLLRKILTQNPAGKDRT